MTPHHHRMHRGMQRVSRAGAGREVGARLGSGSPGEPGPGAGAQAPGNPGSSREELPGQRVRHWTWEKRKDGGGCVGVHAGLVLGVWGRSVREGLDGGSPREETPVRLKGQTPVPEQGVPTPPQGPGSAIPELRSAGLAPSRQFPQDHCRGHSGGLGGLPWEAMQLGATPGSRQTRAGTPAPSAWLATFGKITSVHGPQPFGTRDWFCGRRFFLLQRQGGGDRRRRSGHNASEASLTHWLLTSWCAVHP